MPLTRHHMLPRSKGGGNEPENIQLACRPCHDELDKQAGVRHERAPRNSVPLSRKPKKFKEHQLPELCVKCGNSIPKKLHLGVMHSREVKREKLCQRHAWERERELWHALRESLARKKLPMPEEVDDRKVDEMLRKAGI